MQTPIDRYIQIGHVNTRYWMEGQSGSPILLIHGLGSFAESWLPGLHTLAARHRVYALDLPGHGRSDKPLDGPYKLDDLASFIREFMQKMGLERTHLIGHSLGGGITLRLAALYPQMTDRLVLVSSAALGQEVAGGLRLFTLPLLGEWMTRPNRARTLESGHFLVYNHELLTEEWIDLASELAALPGAQQAYLKTIRQNADLGGQRRARYGTVVASLPAIHNPALVIWGLQDRLLPAEHALVAARGLPNVRLEIFENCGHIPMFEQTEAFCRCVLDFLDRDTPS